MAPINVSQESITLSNVNDGETIHQRAVLITGNCKSTNTSDHLAIHLTDPSGTPTFPVQNWPITAGHFKSLIILSPGENHLLFEHHHAGTILSTTTITLTYIPLLQTPPLHLAIMIAKDSPLLIDCPPSKFGALSSTHSSLEAAINKFRMTAYMWQALTAEDLRSKGLGRRSFRLEEEWTLETLSQTFHQTSHSKNREEDMRSTAKIHLIRSEKTVEEIRDMSVAQQNPQARRPEDLHKYFSTALKKHGASFSSESHPVVAGLILDSTFSLETSTILGHAALGSSSPTGLSLGIFGSHLTYSWPRFLEEVSSCLLDTTSPGDLVGNDSNECGTCWEACSISQGAFLHEVGHAFGADHTSGIMARGYARDWPKNFLSCTAWCEAKNEEGVVVDEDMKNDAKWDLCNALSFKLQRHFWLPGDAKVSKEMMAVEPSVGVVLEADQVEFLRLVITSPVGIVRVKFNGIEEVEPSVLYPVNKIQFTMDELEARFDRSKPLSLDVLGMNGKSRNIGNVWRLFSNVSFIRIPGSSIVLQKRGVMSQRLEAKKDIDERKHNWDWAILLKERVNGKMTRAVAIDSRVGCLLDGAVIYYDDSHKTPCGPRWDTHGRDHRFGGHAAEKFNIPEGVDIIKVEIGRNSHELNGLRFHLSNGKAGGYLYDDEPKVVLEPTSTEKIIGFYGRSDWGRGYNGIEEFGIITAARDVELPDCIYDLPELQNIDGGNGDRSLLKGEDGSEDGSEDEDEDED